MKKTVFWSLFVLLIFTGCQSAQEQTTIKDACLANGHNYVSAAMSGNIISCADVNKTNYIVVTYDPLTNKPNGIGRLEDYVEIIPIQ